MRLSKPEDYDNFLEFILNMKTEKSYYCHYNSQIHQDSNDKKSKYSNYTISCSYNTNVRIFMYIHKKIR